MTTAEHSELIVKALRDELGEQYSNITDSGLYGGNGHIFKASFHKKGIGGDIVQPSTVAIKVLLFKNADDADARKSIINEIEILSEVDDKALPPVHLAGEILIQSKMLQYYVTDFIDGVSVDNYIKTLPDEEQRFEAITCFLGQLLSAVRCLHARNIYHLDIKLANTKLCRPSEGAPPQLILLDLGSAVDKRKAQFPVTVYSTPINWPRGYLRKFPKQISHHDKAPISLKQGEVGPQIDLYMVAESFIRFFDDHERAPLPEEARPKARYVRDLLERLHGEKAKADSISDANSALSILTKWDSRRNLTCTLAGGYVRVPGNGIRHFSGKIRKLVDSRLLQRLRRVNQLALVNFVFPGAEHSRFEHTLGVLENVVSYVDALCDNGNASRFLQDISDDHLKYTVIFALLHDACHYPFSHLLEEEMGDFEHDSLLIRLLAGDSVILDLIPGAASYRNEILEILQGSWGVTDWDHMLKVFRFLSNRTVKLDQCLPETNCAQSMLHVLRDIVNGPIDADKLDYLQRDGHHCGVPYANCIDRHRFLASLSVDCSAGFPRLSMTSKGSACAEALAVSRYLMFNQVYWGHTARSLTCMLQSCVKRHAKIGGVSVADTVFNGLKLFDRNDDDALATVTNIERFSPAECLQMRRPYKRLLVLTDSIHDKDAYNSISDARGTERKPKDDWDARCGKVIQGLSDALFGGDAQPEEILIDVPDFGKYDIGTLNVGSESIPNEKVPIGPLWEQARKAFQTSARKIRIFVHPRLLVGSKVDAEIAKEAREVVTVSLN